MEILPRIQSYRSAASSSPWLSLRSLFLPQASTLRPGILSSSGCPGTGARNHRSLTHRQCAIGTRPRVPGPRPGPLAEAGIRLGRSGRDWSRSCLRGRAPFCLGAGRRRRRTFDWLRWHAGAYPNGGGTLGAGGEMKSLRKQAGKCPPPPALGSATLQVGRAVGSWAGGGGVWPCPPSGGQVLRVGGRAHGARPRSRPSGGGDTGAEVLWGCYSQPGMMRKGRWERCTQESGGGIFNRVPFDSLCDLGSLAALLGASVSPAELAFQS